MLEGRAAWTVVEEDGKASDGIGVENIDTKIGTTKLFGLPEATGVAMADVAAAKPAPDVANDEAWAASWLACVGEHLQKRPRPSTNWKPGGLPFAGPTALAGPRWPRWPERRET